MNRPDDRGEMARHVIDTNRYLTIGTTEPDQRPRLSPVYFTHVDYHDELPQRCAEAFARVAPGAKRFQPHELRGDAVRRLYRARATSHEVHIPGRDPVYGAGVDTRRSVTP